MIEDDGDIVRGLGFVTLYATYLEEQIVSLLWMLDPVTKFDQERQRWSISRHFKHIKRTLNKLHPSEFNFYKDDLTLAKSLFKERNEVVHGRIYGGLDRPNYLKSNRPNYPTRNINSSELYSLANDLNNMQGVIHRPMILQLPKAIQAYSAWNAHNIQAGQNTSHPKREP